MVVGASRAILLALSLLALAAALLYDTAESNHKKIKCARGSQHDFHFEEISEAESLGCRLTLIYDEYFAPRMIYYDFHRKDQDSPALIDCDDDGFISVVCEGDLCNLKIADSLRKGARDTVARNYYLQCLYHKSLQENQSFIPESTRAMLRNFAMIAAAMLVVWGLQKYKNAQKQRFRDMIQAYERKKEYNDKLTAQAIRAKEAQDKQILDDLKKGQNAAALAQQKKEQEEKEKDA